MVVAEVKPYQVLWVRLWKDKSKSTRQTTDVSKLVVVKKQRVDNIVDLFLSLFLLFAILNLANTTQQVFLGLQRHKMVSQKTSDSWLMRCFRDDDASLLDILTFLAFALLLNLILLLFLIFFIIFLLFNRLSLSGSGAFFFQGNDISEF